MSQGVSRPHVRGHRGDSRRRPENTLAAFRAALDEGADGIEFDVHVTADGHPVVIHDYDLTRTTSGSGLVHERDLAYVRSLSAGAWFGEEFATERVPLLEEVLALDAREFERELKGLSTQRLIDAILSCARNAHAAERVEFTGHDILALAKVREAMPHARLGLLAPPRQAWMTDGLYEQLILATATLGRFEGPRRERQSTL